MFVIISVIVTFLMAVTSMIITKYRRIPKLCNAVYGVLLFFICSLPLLAEGGIMYELSRVDRTEILKYCEMGPKKLARNTGRLTRSLMTLAHRFD